MPSLALVEVVEILPSLWFRSCGSVVGSCATLETSSFFQLVFSPSAAPVACLPATLLPWYVNPMPITQDSQWVFHMFEHFGYLAACTLRQEILIYQLRCGQWLPFGLVCLEGFRAQCGDPSLLCAIGVVGLLLRFVTPLSLNYPGLL